MAQNGIAEVIVDCIYSMHFGVHLVMADIVQHKLRALFQIRGGGDRKFCWNMMLSLDCHSLLEVCCPLTVQQSRPGYKCI